MIHPNALSRFQDVAALWSAGHARPAEVVQAACDALARGGDGRGLAMLAALPLRTADDHEMLDLLNDALNEPGLASATRLLLRGAAPDRLRTGVS